MLAKRPQLGAELEDGNNTRKHLQAEEDSARYSQLSPYRIGDNPFFIWANGRLGRVARLWHFKPAGCGDFLDISSHIRESGVPH